MRGEMVDVKTGRDIEMKKHPESVRFKNITEHTNLYFKTLYSHFNQDIHSNENSLEIT